ncbi:hypothetical protein MiSe_31800 [Microseira wollei NIES-4236]|uniref:Ribbon-helix-helix protein CopG domain-containing protein n=1 Tax=Microseira wollei NIES-4236 TaxID=2530354 RepID=A0AAV3XDJ4_9CYAN|nr:hypothetical protein MiSe_31800 [Microseira wollei NIES-4236]
MPQLVNLLASEQTNSNIAASSWLGFNRTCWHPYIWCHPLASIISDVMRQIMMKTKKVEVRMREYEYNQLRQEAIRRGMTNCELVRSIIAKLPEPK